MVSVRVECEGPLSGWAVELAAGVWVCTGARRAGVAGVRAILGVDGGVRAERGRPGRGRRR